MLKNKSNSFQINGQKYIFRIFDPIGAAIIYKILDSAWPDPRVDLTREHRWAVRIVFVNRPIAGIN